MNINWAPPSASCWPGSVTMAKQAMLCSVESFGMDTDPSGSAGCRQRDEPAGAVRSIGLQVASQRGSALI